MHDWTYIHSDRDNARDYEDKEDESRYLPASDCLASHMDEDGIDI